MFELCKKVEIDNIQNNYYFYRSNQIDQASAQKLGLHLLKVSPLDSKHQKQQKNEKYFKKGLTLSKTIDCYATIKKKPIQLSPMPQGTKKSKLKLTRRSSEEQPLQNNGNSLFRLKTNVTTELNDKVITSLYCKQQTQQKTFRKNYKGRVQQIYPKNKPNKSAVFPTIIITTQKKIQNLSLNPQQTIRNLTDTKPAISSKIQTSCTNGQNSNHNITEKWSPQMNASFGQIQQNSSSKLISISKSVSSLQQTITEKDYRRHDYSGQNVSRSDNQVSINLSNIFSPQQFVGSDKKRERVGRDSPMKRLSLFLDSQRHTVQSRLSRQFDFGDQGQVKIEQSFVCQHDPKANFDILPSNQINKKDYTLSQAVQKNINMLVSIKQFISNQTKLIVQQLQTYDTIENHLVNQTQYGNVLEFYQVQHCDGRHLLIRQPYTESLQARLKKISQQQGNMLRSQCKQIMSKLIDFLKYYNMRPIRQITIHEFVVCMNQIKLHDLSIFSRQSCSVLDKEAILSGIDI